jgi:RNA polymerase sigma-70 factor (ECF subfamily)
MLAQMTGSLSKGQKEAVDLLKLKEMSLAEASALSGQSIASLKVNVHRAMKKMRLTFTRDLRK